MLARKISRRQSRNDTGPSNDNRPMIDPLRIPLNLPLDFPDGGANDNNRSPKRGHIRLRDLGRLGRTLPWLGGAFTLWELYELYGQSGLPEGFTNLGSWYEYVRCDTPPNGPIVRQSVATTEAANGAPVDACLPLQAYSTNGDEESEWWAVANNVKTIWFGKATNTTTRRCTLWVGYARPDTGAFTPPDYQPARPPVFIPVEIPAVQQALWHAFPQYLPVSPPPMANPFLQPLPFRQLPNREDSPYRQTSNGPKVGVRGWSYPSEVLNDYAVSHAFNGRKPLPAPRVHDREPPRRGTKERKVGVPAAMVPILKAVNALTEGLDFLDALYDALPRQAKAKWRDTNYEWLNPTPSAKLAAVYFHAEQIDLSQALENLVVEQLKDIAYGRIGRMGAETSRILGRPYGTGLNSLTRLTGRTTSEYRNFEHSEEE